MAAISKTHSAAGHAASPTSLRHAVVAETWAGVRRAKGVAQNAKTAAVTATPQGMIACLSANRLGVRDRALLLIGQKDLSLGYPK